MIQVMEQFLLASNPPARPSEADIVAEFERRHEELRRAPRYSIEHIYFDRAREAEAAAVIAKIEAANLTPQQARELSSPFLPGYRFTRQTPDQLARNFGTAFVQNLTSLDLHAGQWVGPVRSTYGTHYVWLDQIEAARDAELDEVRPQVQRDLESLSKQAALRHAIHALRENSEIRQ